MIDPSRLHLTTNFTTTHLPLWPRSLFKLYLRSPHGLGSCAAVFPEDVCALYYSVSSIMTPGFMSPSATFIASDILLLPLMDDNIPLNKTWRESQFMPRVKCEFMCILFSSCGVTSSSSSTTSSARMSSADCSISLLPARREVRGVFILTGLSESRQFKQFEMKVLHGVLEDIGVEMRRAWDVCGETEKCFLTPTCSCKKLHSGPRLWSWLSDKSDLVWIWHLKALGTCAISIPSKNYMRLIL